MERSPQFGVLSHAVTVSSDVDEVAVVQNAVDESGGHDFVAKDLAPFLETFVRGEHGRSALVSPTYELEKKHRAGLGDG